MRVIVLVADEHAFAGPAHAMLLVVLFETLESRDHRGIFFWLVLLGAEGVVAEWIEADGLWLICGKGLGEDGTVYLVSFSKCQCRPLGTYGYDVWRALVVMVDMAFAE